jgi:hypothetical protein
MLTIAVTLALHAPPARYDFEPQNYVVLRLSTAEVEKLCGVPTVGCAYPPMRTIVVDDSLSGDLLQRVLRHERGHINGWPADHSA